MVGGSSVVLVASASLSTGSSVSSLSNSSSGVGVDGAVVDGVAGDGDVGESLCLLGRASVLEEEDGVEGGVLGLSGITAFGSGPKSLGANRQPFS